MLVNNYETQCLPLKTQTMFSKENTRKTTDKVSSFSIFPPVISTCTTFTQTSYVRNYVSLCMSEIASKTDEPNETHEVQKGNFERLFLFFPDIWFLCLNSFSTLTFPDFLVLLIKTHCFHLLHLSLLWFQRR